MKFHIGERSAEPHGFGIAPNGADFVDAVWARCGVIIEIISGEDEGRLAYLAANAGIGHGPGSRVVFDTGGGSSQFTFGLGDGPGPMYAAPVSGRFPCR